MGDAIRLTGGNRNTLKQHFQALVEQGHLAQHGAGRGVWSKLKQGYLSASFSGGSGRSGHRRMYGRNGTLAIGDIIVRNI